MQRMLDDAMKRDNDRAPRLAHRMVTVGDARGRP
jgi:hypothetical protein